MISWTTEKMKRNATRGSRVSHRRERNAVGARRTTTTTTATTTATTTTTAPAVAQQQWEHRDGTAAGLDETTKSRRRPWIIGSSTALLASFIDEIDFSLIGFRFFVCWFVCLFVFFYRRFDNREPLTASESNREHEIESFSTDGLFSIT